MLTADLLPRSGKVRDIYELPDHRLALVASDRISAFDVILPTQIPDKGRVLTGLSRYWFDETQSIIRNHLLDTDVDVVVGAYAALLEERGQQPRDVIPDGGFDGWRGRVMVCRPAVVVPIEAVVRGYLSGSAWKEYRQAGSVCGIDLPPGLRESDRLPEPIFTPATKAPAGRHDENLTFDGAIDHVGRTMFDDGVPNVRPPAMEPRHAAEVVEAVRDAAVKLYRYGAALAAKAGIILADTKFEFGLPTSIDFGQTPTGPREEWIERRQPIGHTFVAPAAGSMGEQVMLVDEVMTPDSARLWDAAAYAPGGPQASFDKQFVRDWLERQPWDKTPPGPELPPDVVAGTRARYVEAFERITGASFGRYLDEDVIAPAEESS